MTYDVRIAIRDDLPAIIDLASTSAGAPQWTRKQYEDIFLPSSDSSISRALFVAQSGSELSGFCVVSSVADEAELESIVVASTHRRLGFGSALCRHALDWLRTHAVQQVWLEVRESNIAAQSLYRSLHFEKVGRRPAYYAEPTEDAVLMRTSLPVATHL